MPEIINLIKDPFEHIDAYNEEAFIWAQKISNNINIGDLKEKDPFFISLSFAYIFGGFLYCSMNYSEPNTAFENYLIDCFFEKEIDFDPWTRMHSCRDEISALMKNHYGLDPLTIYRMLYDAILIESVDDYGDFVKREPYDFDELKTLSFVMNGLSY